jgi:hypothetical protein
MDAQVPTEPMNGVFQANLLLAADGAPTILAIKNAGGCSR